MADATVDVVVPVWNRPNETRNCIVSLIDSTPGARLILFDIGSERETEKLLQEFADGLDDRALLMRDDSNIGFVRAANRGMERSEAPFIALLRNTTRVCSGWLEPLLKFASAHPEAGILLPCQSPGEAGCSGPIEVASASFAAMLISRRLFQEIGAFDEAMDGGEWCLRDYARRACSRGFLTYRVPGPAVSVQEEVQFGSERRRQETLQRTRLLFQERWGEAASYALHVPKGVELDLLGQKLESLLKGARYGHSFSILLPAVLFKSAQQAGLDILHENIRLVPLPRLSGDAGKRRVFERIGAQNPGTVPVTAVDGIAFPWSPSYLSFTELSESIGRGQPRHRIDSGN